MGRIPEDVIEKILDKADIESVVGKYVTFTKRTGQNLFGLCPFHSEKTPSFSISLTKNIFRCFGCQKGGNSIKFIMEVEHLSYPEAIRFLGNQYGIEVPESSSPQDEMLKQRRTKVYAILEEAARFYYSCFNSEEGKNARSYATGRQLSKNTLIHFGVGFAPAGWDRLYKHLVSKGFTDAQMEESGLFTKSRKTGRLYDLLRDRLVFPIFDAFGKIVAFGGRRLNDNADEPKYVNSPDSLVYKKQEHLYGLNFASKQHPRQLIIVEGYMDTVQMYQAGVTNVVAALGTAFTDTQLRLAARFAEEIVFFFDSDKAGQKAAIRAVHMLLIFLRKMAGMTIRIRIACVPDGKDPDEFIKLNGVEQFRHVVEKAKDVDDYLFDRAYDDNNNEEGVLDVFRFRQDITEYGSWIKDELKREKMAAKAARYLGANSATVLRIMNDRMESEEAKRFEKNLYKPRPSYGSGGAAASVPAYEETEGNDYQDDDARGGERNPEQNSDKNPEQEETPSIPRDIAYGEELAVFVYAMRLKERLGSEVDREDVLRVSDFMGQNMQQITEYFLHTFSADHGVREDLMLNKLSQYMINGRPGDDTYLRECTRLRDSNNPKVQRDMYLLSIYNLRIARIELLENQYAARLTQVPPNERGEIKEAINRILRVRERLIEKRSEL